MLEKETIEAQQALDELFSEDLIPFELSAHRMNPTGTENVRFAFTIAVYIQSRCRGSKASALGMFSAPLFWKESQD